MEREALPCGRALVTAGAGIRQRGGSEEEEEEEDAEGDEEEEEGEEEGWEASGMMEQELNLHEVERSCAGVPYPPGTGSVSMLGRWRESSALSLSLPP